ncbi:MAG: hypothetical protein R6W75_05285 [Smithellaceae bacterium]
MNKPALIDNYFEKYAADASVWKITANYPKALRQVVVIPAYAENEMLFGTLVSLARNPASQLEKTLIICVVNNKQDAGSVVRENNFQTIQRLDALIENKSAYACVSGSGQEKIMQEIAASPLKLGYVDASSHGCEIPRNEGGVGMARKIGMDAALSLLRETMDEPGLILSLDADTRVEPNYLEAISQYFTNNTHAAVVAYAHDLPEEPEMREAICCYEIFLRYWVLGLRYARSPYAYHAVASTIVTTARAYLDVRGMNRRAAGEDFYFLNKLAKLGQIGHVNTTKIYPSARISDRVPFGTGAAMERTLSGQRMRHLLYDPRVFDILAKWLLLMKDSCREDPRNILEKADNIHPRLSAFLMQRRFTDVWTKIGKNVKSTNHLHRQFHIWFDGFETLKLVNDLTRNIYPGIDMYDALSTLLKQMSKTHPDDLFCSRDSAAGILRYLRAMD